MAKGKLILFLALFLVCPSDTYVHASVQQKALRSRQIGTESQIISRMFSEYDSNVRPPVRDSADHSSIVVIVSVFINRIKWEGQTATVDLYLRQQYEDSRLSYEVDTREKIDEVILPSSKTVWKPDTYFTSAQEINPDGSHRSRYIVEPNGFIRSSEQKVVSVPVQTESGFPFKNQKSFKLRLSSYAYDIDDVVYLWANSPPTVVPVEVSKELLDGPFAFSEAYAGDCVGNYTVGVHSCVDVTVTFTGPSCDAYLKFFLPTFLLVVASWLHFFIHGSWSVPRTFSAALPFAIFSVFLLFHPDASNLSGAPKFWLVGCLLFTFFSLFEYFLVIGCGVHRRVTRYTPLGVRDGSAEPLSTVITHQPIDNEVNEKQTTTCAKLAANNGIDYISRFLFPIAFLIFLIIFLIFYIF